MFCDEIIEKAYLGQPNRDREGDFFLDCYYDMALHIAGDFREILETEHYYISIQYDGVFLIDKTGPISTIERPNEWIESHHHINEDDLDDTWTDYEWTLFVGEKLIDISKGEKGFLLHFTDFKLSMIPHKVSTDGWRIYPHSYCKVMGAERLIKPCTCGGTGVLVVDFVGDYCIRCKTCHRGTSANPCACDAIDEWNEVQDLCIIKDYPEELFYKHCEEPVDFIAQGRWPFQKGNSSECKEIVVSMGKRIYCISSRYAGNEERDFAFQDICAFNPEMYPIKYAATREKPIHFEGKEKVGQNMMLKFSVGNRLISFKTYEDSLIMDIAEKNVHCHE